MSSFDDLAADAALVWWLADRDAARDENERERSEREKREVQRLEGEVAALRARLADLERRSK